MYREFRLQQQKRRPFHIRLNLEDQRAEYIAKAHADLAEPNNRDRKPSDRHSAAVIGDPEFVSEGFLSA